MKYLDIKPEVVRDSNNVTKTINVTIKLHTNPPHTFTDQNGVEQYSIYEGYNPDDTLVATRSCVYTIPEDVQTDLLVGFEPHNHENELAYQALYSGWWAGIKEMAEYQAKYTELLEL